MASSGKTQFLRWDSPPGARASSESLAFFRGWRLAASTFVGLTLATLAIGGWARLEVFERVERRYIESQSKASADHAGRIAAIIEGELAAGLSRKDVLQRFQESLSQRSDDDGFLCLLDM